MEKSNSQKFIRAYKGFEKNLQCRGFQYEIGKKYSISGDIKLCEKGFHACEFPMDAFYFYDMFHSRFCEVKLSGKIDRDDDIVKACASKIKIVKELTLREMIMLSINMLNEYELPIVLSGRIKDVDAQENSNIELKDRYAKIVSMGNYACITSRSFCGSRIGSSGHMAQINTIGNCASIGSSGHYATIHSSGDCSSIGSSGDSAKIFSSGNEAKIGSIGKYASIYSGGSHTSIASFGDHANIVSNGTYAEAQSSGNNCFVCCCGIGSKVKAEVGSWITLSEYKLSEDRHNYDLVCIKTEYIDGCRIKANTWYKLVGGEFVEA